MQVTQPYDPQAAGWRADGDPWPLPVSMRQVRTKLAGFATLTLLALTLGLPLWSQVALLGATLAIPAAVALHGGRRLLGALFFGPDPWIAPGARRWGAHPGTEPARPGTAWPARPGTGRRARPGAYRRARPTR